MHDVSLYVLELLENAIRAGAATIRTTVALDRCADVLTVMVEDDGPGLQAPVERVLDPFFTTKKRGGTGLGLSLFKAEAEAAGGSLTVDSSPDLGGARVRATLGAHHVDRPPIGDLPTTLAVTAFTNPQATFLVTVLDVAAGIALYDAPHDAAATALSALAASLDHSNLDNAVIRSPRVDPAASNGAAPSRVSSEPEEAEARTKEKYMANDSQDCIDTHSCGCGCEEEASEEELLARLDEVIADYKEKPGALIPVLQIAQGIFGYLPKAALKKIALGLGKPYSEVAGVVGFYSFFSTVPRGRNIIRVCLGTACYVRGGLAVLDSLKKELGIDVGETTEDREFSLEVARCFGACGLAPVITINDEVHHRVKPKRIAALLEQYAPTAVAAERSA